MGFSDRILGKKNVNGSPRIEAVVPSLALAGGEIRITGSGLRPPDLHRPKVQFGDVEGSLVVSSDSFSLHAFPKARPPDPLSSPPTATSAIRKTSRSRSPSPKIFIPSPI